MIAKLKKIFLKVWSYIKVNAHSLDVMANTLLGGDEGETASARWGRSPEKNFLYRYGCKFLNLFEAEHCRKAHEKYSKMREGIK